MKRGCLISGILLAVIGLLLFLFPAFWVNFVVILLGLASIVYGVYTIKYTRALFENTVYERTILIKSIVSIVAGIIVVIFPLTVAKAAWNVMIWILIIYLIVSAVLGFFAASLLKDTGIDRKRYILENLGLLALAVILIILSPKTLGSFIIKLIGIAAIILGAFLIILDLNSKSKKDIVISAENVEVSDAEVTDKADDNDDDDETKSDDGND